MRTEEGAGKRMAVTMKEKVKTKEIHAKDNILTIYAIYIIYIYTMVHMCVYICKYIYVYTHGFPGGSMVKNLSSMQEMPDMWIPSQGREDPLEEGMASHSKILAWRIPWTENPVRLQSIRS